LCFFVSCGQSATAAASALTEAESIAAELNVLRASELARAIASLHTALAEADN